MGLDAEVADIMGDEGNSDGEEEEKMIDTTGGAKKAKITSALDKKSKATSKKDKPFAEDISVNPVLEKEFDEVLKSEDRNTLPPPSSEDSDCAPMPSIVDKKPPKTAEEKRIEKI